MPKTKMMRYLLMFFLFLPLITFAQTDEIKKYKIIKGDTLWDISGRDLKDPFLWPEIWKENSWIVNPDLIYPNQIIKIPLYLIKKEMPGEEGTSTSADVPSEESFVSEDQTTDMEKQSILPSEPAKEESVQITKSSLVPKNIIMASGYIADTIPDAGRVNDLFARQLVAGSEDIIYLDTNSPTKVGERFYVINSSKSIKHPVTRVKMGYVITIKGIVEVLKVNDKEITAKITKFFNEINVGDRLAYYYDIETPLTEGNFRTPDIDGTIVATSNNVALQAMLDIVYIDKGCKDGIEVGDMFKTITTDDHSAMSGVIQVISCKDHTATAIIKSSINPISTGNKFTGLTKK